MKKTPIASVLLVCFLLMQPWLGLAKEDEVSYVADSYDPSRDAFADLEAAKALAAEEGKRILLVVGGNWCPWCQAMSGFLKKNREVKRVLSPGYVVMKVNVSDETSNTAFLNPYPAIDTYPHLYILSKTGELIHSQSGEAMQKARPGFEEKAFVAMLKKYASP